MRSSAARWPRQQRTGQVAGRADGSPPAEAEAGYWTRTRVRRDPHTAREAPDFITATTLTPCPLLYRPVPKRSPSTRRPRTAAHRGNDGALRKPRSDVVPSPPLATHWAPLVAAQCCQGLTGRCAARCMSTRDRLPPPPHHHHHHRHRCEATLKLQNVTGPTPGVALARALVARAREDTGNESKAKARRPRMGHDARMGGATSGRAETSAPKAPYPSPTSRKRLDLHAPRWSQKLQKQHLVLL